MDWFRSDINSKTHKLEYEGRVVVRRLARLQHIKAKAVLLTVVLKKTVNLTKKLGQTLGQSLGQTTQTQTPITNTDTQTQRATGIVVHRHR